MSTPAIVELQGRQEHKVSYHAGFFLLNDCALEVLLNLLQLVIL